MGHGTNREFSEEETHDQEICFEKNVQYVYPSEKHKVKLF